jgi:serine phosphatase RsbU (regulator of sigma subunit)
VDDTVVNLLGLYAGLLLMNTLISAFMWAVSRQDLYRDLVALWATMLTGFVAQGITGALFPENHFGIVAGFSTLFVTNLAYANLVSRLVGTKVPWKTSFALFAVTIVSSWLIWTRGGSFTAVALPTAIGVVFPAMYTAVRALWEHWAHMTVSARALMLSCIAVTMHELDYPFLRHLDEYAAMGFTIAIVVVFAMSIFAPAVVLEYVAARQARVAAEMEVAHRIQTRVLPREPRIPGLEISCHMKPAEEVGGDYYDVYTLGQHSWILLGDVTGHGLSSGLVMLMAQSILASILHTRSEISPAELNFLANKILYQNLRRLDELRSMTIVALCRVGDKQRFVYSGNHDHLFVYRAATGEVESVDVSQVPHDLGFLNEFPQEEYAESAFELNPGDLMLLATDGVVEAPRKGRYAEGMFEKGRVRDILKEAANRPLSEVKARLLAELEAFTGGVYHDDVTFVLARPALGEAVAAK